MLISLLGCLMPALPSPAGCAAWAASGECTKNPAFMWAECAADCKGLGLEEPWAKLDEQASAGPPDDAPVLELTFDASSGLAPLRIVLRPDLSPKTVAAVVAAVGDRQEGGATIYRNEAVPAAPPGMCGDILCGPYSLIQGRLAGLSGTPNEAQPVVRTGYVARIQGGSDFFIALDDHTEWGHSFTVWGELHDPASTLSLQAIAQLPYHETAGAGGTIMRLLDSELAATASIVSQRVSDTSKHSSMTPSAVDSAEGHSANLRLNTEL
jgi:hypothetical protein